MPTGWGGDLVSTALGYFTSLTGEMYGVFALFAIVVVIGLIVAILRRS